MEIYIRKVAEVKGFNSKVVDNIIRKLRFRNHLAFQDEKNIEKYMYNPSISNYNKRS